MFDPVSEITIDAPPSIVWKILTDTSRYAAWNPLVVRYEGELRAGARAKLTLVLEGRRTPKIPVRIDVFDPNVELAWTGGPRALLQGTHYFRLHDLGTKTRFVHGERFVGALARVLPLFGAKVMANYAALNEALKREAERVAKREVAVA